MRNSESLQIGIENWRLKTICVQIFSLLAIALSLSSCATVLRKQQQTLYVNCSDQDADILVGEMDSVYNVPFYLTVKRSKEDLVFYVLREGQTAETFYLQPALSNEFLFLNLFAIQGAPIAYTIDLTNPRRFDYGDFVFLNLNDTTRVLLTPKAQKRRRYWNEEFKRRKGAFDLHLSLPYVNGFNSRPEGQSIKVNTGFWGLGFGLNYYYHPSRYIHLSLAGAVDIAYPFPMTVTPDDVRESLGSITAQGSHFFQIKRIELGAGICFVRNSWYYTNELDPDEPISFSRRHNAVGAVFSAFHRVGRNFSMGFVYRPTFWQVHPEVSQKYEHLISFEFRWNVPLRSGKH